MIRRIAIHPDMACNGRRRIVAAVLVLVMSGSFWENPAAAAAPEAAKTAKHEAVVSEPTDSLIPGNRLVLGHVREIRGNVITVDIGYPQPLFVPMRSAHLKGQSFAPGDAIVVTLNDHNAIVDYHHPEEASQHRVLRGRLPTPLTVGLDKAVIETREGVQTFTVADRAKGKLSAMPVGAEVLFLVDEAGQLVDAQLASLEAVRESAGNNKARIKGAHRRIEAVFQSAHPPATDGQSGGEGRLTIIEQDREREMPYRPPLAKLDQVRRGQDIVLLIDDQGYVIEIASPDLPARR
jgi:hypothetical protein